MSAPNLHGKLKPKSYLPNHIAGKCLYILTMDEHRAIQRLKNGDISGLEYLVERHQVKAVRTAYLITRDLGLAEDAVQDSFLNAFFAARGFDAARPFEPWFMKCVVHTSVRMMQRSARQVQVELESDESLLARFASQGESVEDCVESIEVQSQIWDAMQKLSPRQRAVIVQRYFLEMNEKEMANKSGTAVGTIKWMLNAARSRLHALLDESYRRSEK